MLKYMEPQPYTPYVPQMPQEEKLPAELTAQIKSAHTAAIVLAVIFALAGALYLAFSQSSDSSSSTYVTAGIFYLVVAGFYAYVAAAIKRSAPNIKGLMITVGIVTIFFSVGIIPLVADIIFWVTVSKLSRYKRLGSAAFVSDADFAAAAKKSQKTRKIWTIILGSIVVLLIVAIVALVINNNKSSSTSGDDSSFLNQTTPYVSSEFGFKLTFPTFPSTTHDNIDVEGIPVPYVSYGASTNSDQDYYMVQVNQYPTDSFDFSGQERGSLDGAINGMAQTDGYTLLSSSNSGYFMGYPSATATYTASDSGSTYDVYATLFIKGNDMYMIMTVGAPETAYQDFVSSFQFTN